MARSPSPRHVAVSPPRPRASTRKKLDRLLMKAAGLIAEKGFAAMSMRDLQASLGVSLAGLYHYFSSKDDLLFQLQYRTFSALYEQQHRIAEQPGTPEERLQRLLTGHLQFYARHTAELKSCTFELESLHGEPYRIVEEIRRQYYRLMTTAIADVAGVPEVEGEESREIRHVTLFVFGMLNWVYTWYDRSRHGTVEEISREMWELVLNGLKHRGGDR
jgi:AcrR family transcriptional regulator